MYKKGWLAVAVVWALLLSSGGVALAVPADVKLIDRDVYSSFITDGTIGIKIWDALVYRGLPSKLNTYTVPEEEAGVSITEFDVTTDPRSQMYPSVAFGGGRFMIVWSDKRNGHEDIYARICDTSGNPTTDEIRITTNSIDQTLPSVAFGDGRFIVVWYDQQEYNADMDIYARIYDTSGNPTTDEIRITTDPNWQKWPSVAFGDGKFMVVWEDRRNGHGDMDVYGRIYDTSGDPITDDIVIVTSYYKDEEMPSVAFGDGKFVVTWFDSGTVEIYARIYDTSGDPITDEICVTADAGVPYLHSVAFGDGRFMIVWDDFRSYWADPGNAWEDIYARIYDTSGNPLTDEIQMTTDPNAQEGPSVAFGDGKFVVTWDSWNYYANVRGDIYMRAYDVFGNPVTDEVQITAEPHEQLAASVAFGDDRFMVVWEDYRNGNGDIYAALLQMQPFAFSDWEYPSTAAFNKTITVRLEITFSLGDIAGALLIYGYESPYDDYAVGGEREGTTDVWSFEIPAQGSEHIGDALTFWIMAWSEIICPEGAWDGLVYFGSSDFHQILITNPTSSIGVRGRLNVRRDLIDRGPAITLPRDLVHETNTTVHGPELIGREMISKSSPQNRRPSSTRSSVGRTRETISLRAVGE